MVSTGTRTIIRDLLILPLVKLLPILLILLAKLIRILILILLKLILRLIPILVKLVLMLIVQAIITTNKEGAPSQACPAR